MQNNISKDQIETSSFLISNNKHQNKLSKLDSLNNHKKGTLIFKSGNKYIGEIDNDKPNGYGILYHKDGSWYEGQFVNGLRDGNGTLHLNSPIEFKGDKYVGNYKQNKKNFQFNLLLLFLLIFKLEKQK
jgi:hypothetical protein